ncbi:MAG: hypothetical protein OXJ37_07155 [Bryobacterales bacterium]|nr:hypothetical protein [Bryobacterales bacterium]
MQVESMIATRAARTPEPMRRSGPLQAAFALLAIACAAPAGVSLAASPCRFSADLEVTIDATGIERVSIDAVAGDLAVQGLADSSQIRVTGKACAKSEAAVQQIQLLSSTEGIDAYIEAKIPSKRRVFSNATLDLKATVPSRLALAVQDSTGEVLIRNVAALQLQDGTGDIEIQGVPGDASVTDGTGATVIRAIGGSLQVKDGTGPLSIRDVQGSVTVDDGTGGIKISEVGGDLRLRDGTGDVEIEDIAGSVDVRDGTGDVSVSRVEGGLTLRNGTGGVQLTEVRGPVAVHD